MEVTVFVWWKASLPHFRSALLASFIWLTFFHNANCFILFCKFLYLILCHIRQVKLNITPKSISLKAREKLFWNTKRYITILPFCLWTLIRVGFYPKHFLIYNKLTFLVYINLFFLLTIFTFLRRIASYTQAKTIPSCLVFASWAPVPWSLGGTGSGNHAGVGYHYVEGWCLGKSTT